jgi:hypothetical protein
MYIVRDIFHLHFGRYQEAKMLLEEAMTKGLLPDGKSSRILTDFTGESYRLIFEEGYDSMDMFEHELRASMSKPDWKKWYERFKPLIKSGHREILKQVH